MCSFMFPMQLRLTYNKIDLQRNICVMLHENVLEAKILKFSIPQKFSACKQLKKYLINFYHLGKIFELYKTFIVITVTHLCYQNFLNCYSMYWKHLFLTICQKYCSTACSKTLNYVQQHERCVTNVVQQHVQKH